MICAKKGQIVCEKFQTQKCCKETQKLFFIFVFVVTRIIIKKILNKKNENNNSV